MAGKTKFRNTLVRNRVQFFGFLFGSGIFYFLATLPPIFLKRIPLPWLVCWSDPLTPGACPAGSIQHFLTLGDKGVIPLFAIGFLAIIGAIFGRMTCGWLCPFGYLQDILYRLKKVIKWLVLIVLLSIIIYLCWTSPMFSGYVGKSGSRISSPLRNLLEKGRMSEFYLWLVAYGVIFAALFSLFLLPFKKFTIGNHFANWGRVFFFLVPFIIFPLFANDPNMQLRGPWFCKICPSGTTFAALPQFLFNALPKSAFPLFGMKPDSPFIPYGLANYQDIRPMGQVMFALKIVSFVLVIWITTLSKRVFCKFVCPIGMFFSGFNYFSAIRVVVDKEICKGEKCNVCWKVCPMDIKLYDKEATSHCIGCLECVSRCPFHAAKVVRPSFFNWLISAKSYSVAKKK